MYYCGLIYLGLKKISEANDCFNKIVNGGFRITKEANIFVKALKINIICNEIMGKGNYSKDEIKRIFEEMKIMNPLMD